jgi:hypothetical protein
MVKIAASEGPPRGDGTRVLFGRLVAVRAMLTRSQAGGSINAAFLQRRNATDGHPNEEGPQDGHYR